MSIPLIELKWSNNLQTGDTLVYKSDSGEVERFLVNSFPSKYTICNKFEISDEIYESKSVYMESLDSAGREIRFYISALPDYKGGGVLRTISVLGTKNTLNIENGIKEIEVEINGKHLSVLKLDHSEEQKIWEEAEEEVKYFYWSRTYGVVQYFTSKGQIFTLSKHLSKPK